mmetsp:Transcript_3700/g.6648  ORF Transcript_3700/g.6648 Transcript_3700/m.6648 type:complete len:283 (-) Transcript_3700:1093-1941(-)
MSHASSPTSRARVSHHGAGRLAAGGACEAGRVALVLARGKVPTHLAQRAAQCPSHSHLPFGHATVLGAVSLRVRRRPVVSLDIVELREDVICLVRLAILQLAGELVNELAFFWFTIEITSLVPCRALAHELYKLLKVQRAIAILIKGLENVLGYLLADLRCPELVDITAAQNLRDFVLGYSAVVVLNVKGFESCPKDIFLEAHTLSNACGAELRVVNEAGAIQVQLLENPLDIPNLWAVLAEELLEASFDLVELKNTVAVRVHLRKDLVDISKRLVVQLTRH